MASLRANVAANFASQIYVAVVGLSLIPIHLGLLGAEGYGLVGLFALLQSWFQILDVGLTPTISRETARYVAGGQQGAELRQLLRSMEVLFWVVGLVAAALIAAAAPLIAQRWLNPSGLSIGSVQISIVLMAWTVALRWVCGLYRGVVAGMERQVWLGAFNAAVTTFRFGGVIPVLLLTAANPIVFFAFQAIVSIIELAVLVAFAYSLVPLPQGVRLKFVWSPLKRVFEFSAIIAFTSVVAAFINNMDKVVLSRLLSLADFGFFTAAVLVASGITLATAPITLALLPSLTRHAECRDVATLVGLYRQATQAVAAIAGSGALLLTVFGERVLWTWTGDAQFAADYATVVILYAIGNGFFALASFPFFLQYARGNLRLHLFGNVLFLVILVPSVILATMRFGAVGAGSVWALSNAAFFLAWTAFVHKHLLPGLHFTWLREDVIKVLVGPAAVCALLYCTANLELSRLGSAILIVCSTIVVCVTALCGASSLKPKVRPIVTSWIHRLTPDRPL